MRNSLGQDVIYSSNPSNADAASFRIDTASSLGCLLQRRISMSVRQASLNSTQHASLALPPTSPPTDKDSMVPALQWLNLLGQRWKWKASAIVLARFRDLFLARVAMRWVISIGQSLLGPSPVWLSPASLTLFWAADFLVLRRARLGPFSCLSALWSFNIFTQDIHFGWTRRSI